MNFWQEAQKNGPIIGLSPMDGVTDAPFRYVVAQTSSPSVMMTEFVNVEGLARGATKMLDDFLYHECERPIVAQIYGIELESFYAVALMACHLGFDGIDINMGCPAKKVSHRGAGSGLIRTPNHAQEIVKMVKKAVEDFSNGKTLEAAGIRPKIITAIESNWQKMEKFSSEKNLEKNARKNQMERKKIPVSIKTRTGYDSICAENWMEYLLETSPDAITLHGRTLKQMYTGKACWETIGKAAEVVKKSGLSTVFLGNGDVQNRQDALEKTKNFGLDGVLIGRAAFGNPWIFSDMVPTDDERREMAIFHAEMFEKILPDRQFFIMRKHLAWYMKNFEGASKLRSLLMMANSAEEVRKILSEEISFENIV